MHQITATPGQLLSRYLTMSVSPTDTLDRLSTDSGIPSSEIRDLAFGNSIPLVGDRDRLSSIARAMGLHDSSMSYRSIMKGSEFSTDGKSQRFRMSTPDSDRYRDIVIQDWITTGFDQNPVAPWNHDYSIPPIGRWERVGLSGPPGSVCLEGYLVFDDSPDNPLAQLVARQYRDRFLNTCSVGFIPTMVSRRSELDPDDPMHSREGYVFRGNQLLECSAVVVPGNAGAVMLSTPGAAAAPPDTHPMEWLSTPIQEPGNPVTWLTG